MRASVLRGMGAGAARASHGNQPSIVEGGAGGGGGENNLAFKVRRKRLVIETLHLDVEGGVSERRTKPPKNMEPEVGGGLSTTGTKRATAQNTVPPPAPTTAQTRAPAESQPPTAPVPAASHTASTPSNATRGSFAGLRSLRERGLAAARPTSGGPTAPREIEVEVDGTRQGASASHAHGRGANTQKEMVRRTPVFSSDRPEDYEF